MIKDENLILEVFKALFIFDLQHQNLATKLFLDQVSNTNVTIKSTIQINV